ncbi:ABC transporter permease [Roseisolibacter sp. H3M3-2]|uniref:ABC transporter permease n=1 Tax=Roseisolibacter sp. H3M3-2 TaxID=3031323 RepID=UPI0023DC4202|nr:ABC transporter permease [Roseisolibacter sp. H3M3-2]MDF1505207.1 ABC transporter permease [Roseisolibacter sp. H3M3-2]
MGAVTQPRGATYAPPAEPPGAPAGAPAPHGADRAATLRLIAFGLRAAIEAVGHNTLRAALTSLGILFGVASVIAMLAIGKGAEQEILAQMKLLGSNNVIVTPSVEQKEEKAQERDDKESKRFSPGLTALDAQSIRDIVPQVRAVSTELSLQSTATREGQRRSVKLVGVDSAYFDAFNLDFAEGSGFAPIHLERGMSVAVIGSGLRARFFTKEPPVGRRIKVGENWLTVVGVLAPRPVSEQTAQRLGIRDANMDVYVPLATALVRYRNRAQITNRDVERASQEFDDGEATKNEDAATRAERLNQNQLDRLVVQVADARYVGQVADVVRRLMERRHNQVIDFEVAVPEMLLKQEQRTKTIFNVVLGAIASISLIVGGIGIMNIMLASVLERIREIGVRRALGASQRDVLAQFLAEAVLISLAGGMAGIMLGVALSYGIERFAKIATIVSPLSVIVAFGVSLTVGLVFGIVPAWRAARQDPVVCLRYE